MKVKFTMLISKKVRNYILFFKQATDLSVYKYAYSPTRWRKRSRHTEFNMWTIKPENIHTLESYCQEESTVLLHNQVQ